jgi:hypothetical protein
MEEEIRLNKPTEVRTDEQPGLDECERLRIDDYRLDEVILPSAGRAGERKAIRVQILGRNFRDRAIPLWAFVGETPVKYMRRAPDGRSLEGVLLEEPPRGSQLRVSYADTESATHPKPFDPADIKRIV